jgi:Cu(I)/Ag(I) efflux system membrane protein CusA/SilA
VETSVVMLLYLNLAWERLAAGKAAPDLQDLYTAVIEGAVQRLRPKLMTALTVIVGLLPIMFGSGTGSEVMRRIAAPMVGGMVTSTALTLLVIPAAFLLWQRARLSPPPAKQG